MYPDKEFMKRFEVILAELDVLAGEADDEELDDLNAELEDALLLLGQLRPDDVDAREELSDTLEEIKALAGDYRALEIEGVGEPAARLSMAAEMAMGSLEA